MTKLDVAKTVVKSIVGVGTTKIVYAIIQNNTDPEDLTDKVTMTAGSVVIGAMAADASSAYTDTKIDEIATWWKRTVR